MISIDEIKKISKLARIELKSGEEEELQKDLEAVLNYVSKLKEISSENEQDSESLGKSGISNVFRKDEPIKDESEIKKGEYVKVKHVL